MVASKAIGLWALILVLAIVNGIFREAVLFKVLARSTAFTVSGVVLIACVLIVALLSIRWLGGRSLAQYAGVGLLWLVLTLAFEFGFGLLVRGESLATLCDAYRFQDGNIWPLVLVAVAAAPVLAARVRGLADFGRDR
jgi:hypothetical protein